MAINDRTHKEFAILPILHLGPFALYTFGLLFGAAVCLGTFLFLRFFREHNIHVNPVVLGPLLIGSGFLGAKLDNALVLTSYILHRHPFHTSLAEFFASGYTYLGCVLAGSLAGAIYIYLNRLPWLRTFDSLFCFAPAYALGRVGCFLAGDGDYGTPSTLPWAVAFPHGLVPTLHRVHPTMLYSAAWELSIFLVLTSVDRRHPRPGTLLGLYLLATGTGRFLVEFLSRNPPLAMHLSEAQLVSSGLAAAGTLILVFLRTRSATNPKPTGQTFTGRQTRRAVFTFVP